MKYGPLVTGQVGPEVLEPLDDDELNGLLRGVVRISVPTPVNRTVHRLAKLLESAGAGL